MAKRSDTLLLWSPRVLGVAVSLFLGVFALDAFGGGKTLVQSLPEFLIHLAPAVILLSVVAASWRREWIGGLVFTGLAAVYAGVARHNVSWLLVISVPLLAVGVLFFWSWAHRRRLHTIA